LNPDLDIKLRMSFDKTVSDDAVEVEGGGLADPAIHLASRQYEEGEAIVEAVEESEGAEGQSAPPKPGAASPSRSSSQYTRTMLMMLIDDSLWPTLLVHNP
jgi:hypothetical protein